MNADKLKKELVALIENTDDEELLSLLKEDFVFYSKIQSSDITDQLNNEQLSELKELAEEDPDKDTESLEEFKKNTDKWRLK
ncbi:MAG TPA: hypothetical protein VL946_14690 [Lacibacter sp.]|nr:hypothetical protein [Lacibacter sp.]